MGARVTSNQRNWVVFFAAIAATSIVSALFLGTAGSSDENVLIALRLSARLAFIVLLVIFIARPLQQMFATPFTAKLLRNRRLLGVTFTGIHTAHLGLIIYRAQVNSNFEILVYDNLLGMLTYTIIAVMFATSFNATARMLGAKNWRILHTIGLYWLVGAFAQTQLPDSLDHLADVNWLLIGLIFAALVIRSTAFLAGRRKAA
jgi:sulfoxide reductase heme-binding subunit YedZ